MDRYSDFTEEQERTHGRPRAWMLLAFAVMALTLLPSCGMSDAAEGAARAGTSTGGGSSSSQLSYTIINGSPFEFKATPGGDMKPGQRISAKTSLSSVTIFLSVRAGNSWRFVKTIHIKQSGTYTLK